MTRQNPGRLVIQYEEKRPRYINGQEIPNWQQGPGVSEAVSYLAGKGWLLFHDLSDLSALWLGHGKLTFIRPKQYLFIRCDGERPRYINGQEIPNWQQGPTVWEAVFRLGQKGWILLSDRLASPLGFRDLTLIRPKH